MKGNKMACKCGDCGRVERGPHLFQLLEDAIIHAILLEINAHGVDDLLDDMVVDPADMSVRHPDGRFATENRRPVEWPRWSDIRFARPALLCVLICSVNVAVVPSQPPANCSRPTLRPSRWAGYRARDTECARDGGVLIDVWRSWGILIGMRNSSEVAAFARTLLLTCLAVCSKHSRPVGFVFLERQMQYLGVL